MLSRLSTPSAGPRSAPTATFRAAYTTRPRPGSRPSRSRPAWRSSTLRRPGLPPARLSIKEERSDLVKHHLWVLWTDYFKPPHFEKYPQLHQLFNEATKLAGAGGTKGSTDVAVADELLAKIDEIANIFWETKQA